MKSLCCWYHVIEQGTLLEQFLSLEFFDKLIKTFTKGPSWILKVKKEWEILCNHSTCMNNHCNGEKW